MLNPFTEVNWSPSIREKRKFAISLIIGFPALAIFFSAVVWMTHHAWKTSLLWLGAIGFLFGVLFWLLPQIAGPFYRAWYFVACCIGFVVGNTLLTVFYYAVITPIGLILRATRNLSFRKNVDKSAPSYWRDAEKKVDLQRYYRQF